MARSARVPPDDSSQSSSQQNTAAPTVYLGYIVSRVIQFSTVTSTALQVLHSLVGYETRSWGLVMFAVLAIGTGGLAWVLNRVFPRLMVWTMKTCSLDRAEYVCCKVFVAKLDLKQKLLCSH